MKKKIYILALSLAFLAVPCFAAPGGAPGGGYGPAGGGMRGGAPAMGGGRAPMHASASFRHDIGRPPMGGRPPVHMAGRPLPPPMHRPYRPLPIYSPYYTSFYYPYYSTYYSYYPYTSSYYYDTVTPVAPEVGTVVVRDPYAGVNTAANVINAAANVASTIRFLTW